MDTTKNRPLIVSGIIWVMLIAVPATRAFPMLWLAFFTGIPIGAIFYLRSHSARLGLVVPGSGGGKGNSQVARESSLVVGPPINGVTSFSVNSASTRLPAGGIILATVIFGIPTLLNASQKDRGPLMAMCIGFWCILMIAFALQIARWSKRRGPLGATFDVDPDGIHIYSNGAPAVVKRSELFHLTRVLRFGGSSRANCVSTKSAHSRRSVPHALHQSLSWTPSSRTAARSAALTKDCERDNNLAKSL